MDSSWKTVIEAKLKCGKAKVAFELLRRQPKDRQIDDWKLMEGNKLFVRIAKWVNHPLVRNRDYHMAGGYSGRTMSRLQAVREVKDCEEIATCYIWSFLHNWWC